MQEENKKQQFPLKKPINAPMRRSTISTETQRPVLPNKPINLMKKNNSNPKKVANRPRIFSMSGGDNTINNDEDKNLKLENKPTENYEKEDWMGEFAQIMKGKQLRPSSPKAQNIAKRDDGS